VCEVPTKALGRTAGMKRLLDMRRTPVGRGYVMLSVMSAAFGLAY